MVLEGLGAEIDRVDVVELRESVFYADLVIRSNGEVVHISSRPSDAIALAVRTQAPVFVAPSVLEEAGIELEDESEEEQVARFRELLEGVTVEDFLGEQGQG
jgi:hypothetical protein